MFSIFCFIVCISPIFLFLFNLYITLCSFPPDMSKNFRKLFRLQVLLKKEHRSCVELFESYALVSS